MTFQGKVALTLVKDDEEFVLQRTVKMEKGESE